MFYFLAKRDHRDFSLSLNQSDIQNRQENLAGGNFDNMSVDIQNTISQPETFAQSVSYEEDHSGYLNGM